MQVSQCDHYDCRHAGTWLHLDDIQIVLMQDIVLVSDSVGVDADAQPVGKQRLLPSVVHSPPGIHQLPQSE